VRPGCEENRSCTDILFLIIFLLFTALWVYCAYLGFSEGDAKRLLYGTDSSGNTCGQVYSTDNSSSVPSDTLLKKLNTKNYTWLGDTWAERTQIWYPMDESILSGDLSFHDQVSAMLKLGVCVKTCPTPTGSDTNPIIFHDYKNATLEPYKAAIQWAVYYDSTSVLNRCLPDLNSNLTSSKVKSLLSSWVMITGTVGTMWDYTEAEVLATWPVMVISVGVTVVLSFLLIFILRWTVGAFVYFVLVIVQALFVGGCAILIWWGLDIEANYAAAAPERDYVWLIYIAGGVCGFIALILFFLIIFMFKRIRVAIEVMKIAAAVMSNTPTLYLVPIITMIFVIATACWAIVVGAYVYTAGSITLSDLTITVPFTNITETLQVSELNDYDTKYWIMWYNLFQFLWTMGMWNAMSFMVIAFCTTMYYFSDPWPGNNKKTPVGAVCISLWWVWRYHLGTIAFGSFIIAVIQLVRIIMAKIQMEIEKAQNDAAKWLGRCIQCYLAYLERVITYINKNAYIVCCIKSSNFCSSAFTAIELLIGNIADVCAANFLADAVFIFCKLLITGGVVVISWVIIKYTSLGSDVTSIVIVLILIGFIAYIISSIFMHLYDCVQDTVLMCYCYDKDKHNGTDEKPYYFNEGLSGIIDKYNFKIRPGSIEVKEAPKDNTDDAS